MTGDTTPISDEAVLADIRLCLASYGFIAANQAEFLLAEVARLSAAPLLVSADSSAQAERHANEMMGLTVAKNEEVDAMEHRARQAESVVEGLRAELAERDAEITKLRATHADALADRDAITRVIMRERDRLRAELSNEVELRKSYQREVAALARTPGRPGLCARCLIECVTTTEAVA